MTLYFKVLLTLLLTIGCGALQAGPAEDAYAAGIAAARAGAAEEAAAHFAEARDAGLDTPALAYNLGVVNFKLDRWDEAAEAFRTLIADPRWRPLAHYNLGLIEERRGSAAEAQYHFQQAHALAADARLKALAARKLPRQEAARRQQEPKAGWQGIFSVAGGHDDNVLLADDPLIDAASDQADQFGEVIAAARRPLGSATSGLALDLSAYYRYHLDLDEFDFGTLAAAFTWRRPLGSWQFSTGLKGDLQFSGGESYANVLTHRLQLDRGAGTLVWRARNDLSYLSGGSDFDFVTGWRNRTQLQISNQLPHGQIQLGYELELNDRDDFESGSEFASYSPTAHGPYAGAVVDLARRLILDVRGSYRISSYRDDNRFLDDAGNLVEAARDQDVLSVRVRLDYQFTERWSLWSQYQHTGSDSSLPRYEYTSNGFLIGLETTF